MRFLCYLDLEGWRVRAMGWLGEYLLELIFPTSCAGCGEYSGELICGRCRDELPLLAGPRCRRCQRPTLYEVDDCADCLRRRPAFDATFAAGLYRDPLRAIIHRLKYRNGRRLVPELSGLMLEAMRQEGGAQGEATAFDAVTFVPMHRRRERQRGYNQAALLAGQLAGALSLEALPLLCRLRPGAAQTGLDLRSRRDNVRGAFGVREVVSFSRRPHLLLVDDVMTSGFTLSECTRALKSAGAGRVTCCVLARDVPGANPPLGRFVR